MNSIKAMFFSSIAVIPAYILMAILSDNIEPMLWFVCLVAFMICLLTTIFICVPVHLIFDKYKVYNPLAYINIGFVIPYLFMVWLLSEVNNKFNWLIWQGTVMGAFGALSAFVFWFFVVKLAKSTDEQK